MLPEMAYTNLKVNYPSVLAAVLAFKTLGALGKNLLRALLNFGHTFGHALETLSGYGTLLHGEAVAIGMLMAARFSQRLGWLARGDVEALRDVLVSLGLPVDPPAGTGAAQCLEAMRGDKKVAGGRIRLVLLRRPGHAVLTADYPDEQLRGVLEEVCAAGRLTP